MPGLDLVVVGGCGHVGLPLALSFAEAGLSVGIYDIDAEAVKQVSAGIMPFGEPGASEVLSRTIGAGLIASTNPEIISTADAVIVTIGTPVDEHLNPKPMSVLEAIQSLGGSLVDGQLIVMRSTLYPGTVALIESAFERAGLQVDVSFCPERIAEGHAMEELRQLPQIVSARSEDVFRRAELLFSTLTEQTVRLSPEEAELAKLFTNTWRYIKFAIANQLYMMANDFGLDYERIRQGIKQDYPRAADLPGAGFAAGPCLFKDTMYLAAFNNNQFVLGHAAMLINEGLPLYVVSKLQLRYDLATMTVGILGMAFKEESDDIRSSLSYKLKRILRFKAGRVLCHDPYVSDDDLVDLETILTQSDILILAAPHQCYLDLQPQIPLVDIWGKTGSDTRI